MIGTVNRQIPEQIGIDLKVRMRTKRPRLRVDGFQAHDSHEASNLLSIYSVAQPPQLMDKFMAINKVRQLTKNSLLNFVAVLLNVGLAFILMPMVIHSLGNELYGIWVLIGTMLGYYEVLDLGLTSGVSRYLTKAVGAQNKEDIKKVASTALFLFSCIGVVILILSFPFAFCLPYLLNIKDHIRLFQIVTIILGVSISVGFPMRIFGGILTAHLRLDILKVIVMIHQISRSIMIFAAIKMHLEATQLLISLASITAFFSIIEFAVTGIYALKAFPHVQLNRLFIEKDIIKRLFSYGSLTSIGTIADLLRFHVDNIVITILLGVSMVTPYSIGYRLISYLRQIVASITGVLSPMYSIYEGANDYDSIRKTLLFGIKATTLLSCFIGFSMLIFGKAFILRWVGQKYNDAFVVMAILAIGFIVAMMQSQGVHLMYGISKHKYVAFMNVFEGLANLILSVILAKKYGIYGVALGTTIPLILTKMILQPVYVCKITNIRIRQYLISILRSFVPPFIIVGGYYTLVKDYIVPDYERLILLSLPLILIYFPIIYFVSFDSTEKLLLKQGLRLIR